MIEIQNASFRYANSDSGVLDEITLHIKDGECVLLCGKSGCGKTSLHSLLKGIFDHF